MDEGEEMPEVLEAAPGVEASGGDDGPIDAEPSQVVILMDDTTEEEEEDEEEKDEKKKLSKEEKARRKRAKERRQKRRAECPVFCSKLKVINSVRYWDNYVLEEYDCIDVRGATVVTGFYTEGLAAGIASKYFVDELKLPLIATMYCEMGMPLCLVTFNQPTDAVRVYGNRDVVVFTSQKILGSDMATACVKAIFDFAKRHHCRHIITIEGVPKQLKIKVGEGQDEEEVLDRIKKAALSDKPLPLRFLTNDEAVGKQLKTAGHKPVRSAVISGVTGGVLARAATSEMSVTGLLSPFNPFGGQSRAALSLVKLLSEMLKIKIDTKTLEENAEELESEIKKGFDKAASARPVKHPGMYM